MKIITATLLFFVGLFSFSQFISDKSLLWKVYGNDIKDTSYLYGTIHMIEKKDFVITPQVKRTFKRSITLVMEVDLEMSDSIKKDIAQKAMFPNRKTIKDYVSPLITPTFIPI
jgi:uncharacterized protein YbaP (TraB family)